jgi:hypothetical protein
MSTSPLNIAECMIMSSAFAKSLGKLLGDLLIYEVEGQGIEGKPFEMHVNYACGSPPDPINFVSNSK